MAGSSARIELQLGVEPESDAEELAELTARLRGHLLQLDVEGVDLARGNEPPPGAKGVDPATVGILLVTLAKTTEGLSALVRTVQGWLSGSPARTVKIQLEGDTLELTGVSSRDQQRLIDVWLERHAAAS